MGPSQPAESQVPYQAQGIRGDYMAGVRLIEDRRFKQMQLAFQEKPSDAVRQVVREAGYQWRSLQGVWSKQIDAEKAWQTRAEADQLFKTVAEMLRAEKGIGHEVT